MKHTRTLLQTLIPLVLVLSLVLPLWVDQASSASVTISDREPTTSTMLNGIQQPCEPCSRPAVQAGQNTDGITALNEAGPLPHPLIVNVQVVLEGEADRNHVHEILDEIERRNWLTTIFVTAEFALSYPDAVTDVGNRGHEIAVGGWQSGEDLTQLGYDEQFTLIDGSFSAVRGVAATPGDVLHFRPQGYRFNGSTLSILQQIEARSITGVFICDEMDCGCWYAREMGKITFPYPLTDTFWLVPIAEAETGSHVLPLDDAYFDDGPHFFAALVQAYDRQTETKDPLILAVHPSITGASEGSVDMLSGFLDYVQASHGVVKPLSSITHHTTYISNLTVAGPGSATGGERVTINVGYTATIYCPHYRFVAYGRYLTPSGSSPPSGCSVTKSHSTAYEPSIRYPIPATCFTDSGWAVPVPAAADGNLRTDTWFDYDSPHYLKNHGWKHGGVDLVGLASAPYTTDTSVYAIGDGTIRHIIRDDHATKNMSALFIEHTAANGVKFMAIYGHAYASAGLSRGKPVTHGHQIGTLRQYGSPMHLHFELSTDLTYTTFDGSKKPATVNPLQFLIDNPGQRVAGQQWELHGSSCRYDRTGRHSVPLHVTVPPPPSGQATYTVRVVGRASAGGCPPLGDPYYWPSYDDYDVVGELEVNVSGSVASITEPTVSFWKYYAEEYQRHMEFWETPIYVLEAFGLALGISSCIAVPVLGCLVGLGIGAIPSAMKSALNVFADIMADPPDQNFREVAEVEVVAEVPPYDESPWAVAKARFVTTLMQHNAIMEAVLVTIERLQGAEQANEPTFVALQARALGHFSELLVLNQQQLQEALISLGAGFLDAINLDYDEIEDILIRLTTEGLSPEEREWLQEAGITPDELQMIENLLQSLEIGDMFHLEVAEALDQWANWIDEAVLPALAEGLEITDTLLEFVESLVSIRGTVTDYNGDPVVNALIQVSGVDYASTFANADGDYLLHWLTSGTYTVSVTPPRYANLMSASRSITVSAGQTGVADFTLQPAAVISGYVTGVDGVPVPNVHVYLSGYETPRFRTHEDGSYVVPGLRAGTHTINIDAQGYEPWHIYVNDTYSTRGTATTVTVALGQTTLVDFAQGLPNEPPVADAGQDQTAFAIPPAFTAVVTLDGSGSHDPDDDPLSYIWTWDGNTAFGANPTVELPLGATTITLVVNDGKVDSEPDTVDVTVLLQAAVGFDPNSLNLRARGGVVTVYIELPEGFDVGQIDVSSIRLNDTVSALEWPYEGGDYNDNGVRDLMVKFDRRAVHEVVDVGEAVEITITGEVDGIPFMGVDTIRVIG